MIIKRKKTRKVLVGSVAIGGGSPISIQSMTKTDTRDVVKTVNQIKQLEKAGCEIVRVAVEDAQAAKAISRIKSKINIPLVADIHFHYKLAIMAAENGADKLRLNPGNIAKRDYIYQVIDCAKAHNIPIRIGLNSGSVKRKKGSTLVNDLVSSADAYLKIFKFKKFEKLILSLKTPEVGTTIEAYRKMSEVTDAPLHLGVTATGLPLNGIVKTSMALGVLLQEGIGDTLRVSLTADPIEEIPVAQDILQALGIRNFAIEVTSCPPCGRIFLLGLGDAAEVPHNERKDICYVAAYCR